MDNSKNVYPDFRFYSAIKLKISALFIYKKKLGHISPFSKHSLKFPTILLVNFQCVFESLPSNPHAMQDNKKLYTIDI